MKKTAKRGVTDVFWVLVYIVAVIVLLAISIFAYVNGDPKTYLYPVDSNGELCGEGRNKDKSLIYYLDFTKCVGFSSSVPVLMGQVMSCSSPKICVRACPTKLEQATLENKMCVNGVDPTNIEELVSNISILSCAPYTIPSIKLFGRCLPNLIEISNASSLVNDSLNSSLSLESLMGFVKYFGELVKLDQTKDEIIKDMNRVRWFGIVYLIIPFLLSMVVVCILGWGSFPIFILFYIISTLVSAAGAVYFGLMYFKPDSIIFEKELMKKILDYMNFLRKISNKTNIFWLFVAFTLVTVFFVIFGILFIKGIAQACACAKEASKSVFYTVVTAVVPLLSWVLQTGFIALFFFVLVFLLTSNQHEYRFYTLSNYSITLGPICRINETKRVTASCIFAGSYTKHLYKIMLAIAIFIIIWSILIVRAISTFGVAFSFSERFWHRKTIGLVSFLVVSLKGIGVAFVFHFGSLVLGSLLITMILAIRIIFEVVMRMFGLNQDKKMGVVVKFIRVGLALLQSLLERISDAAYIQMAVAGKGYCESAREIIATFAASPISTVVVQLMKAAIFYLGTTVVGLLTGFAIYLHLLKVFPSVENKIIISVLFGFLGAMVGSIFFSIYGTGIVTIHYCACHDVKINDGSEERPYKMSMALRNAYCVRNI